MESSLLEQLLIQNTRSYGSISSRIGFIFGRARILGSLKSVSFVRDEGSSPSFAPSEPPSSSQNVPISVLPWASASRRLSFTRPPPYRMQVRRTPGVVRVPSPATVGTVVREKYYYPGKSGRVPSRWRIGHVRTEPAIDGRKEGNFLRPPFSSPS